MPRAYVIDAMHRAAGTDVSILLPFADHEDVIGSACRRVASHLRSLGLDFEILAVDEGSGDNSHAVLTLLRRTVPELELKSASAGRGFAVGVQTARGQVVWMMDPESAATADLSQLAIAHRRVRGGARDLVLISGRFAVCSRARCRAHVESVRGPAPVVYSRLARRVRANGLSLEAIEPSGARTRTSRLGERPLARILETFAPARMLWLDRSRF